MSIVSTELLLFSCKLVTARLSVFFLPGIFFGRPFFFFHKRRDERKKNRKARLSRRCWVVRGRKTKKKNSNGGLRKISVWWSGIDVFSLQSCLQSIDFVTTLINPCNIYYHNLCRINVTFTPWQFVFGDGNVYEYPSCPFIFYKYALLLLVLLATDYYSFLLLYFISFRF